MTNRDYNDPTYKKWRSDVYKRDHHKCQWPNCTFKKRLHAHHIYKWADFPALRFVIDNGISLCKIHHDMIKNQEELYAAVFSKIVASKK